MACERWLLQSITLHGHSSCTSRAAIPSNNPYSLQVCNLLPIIIAQDIQVSFPGPGSCVHRNAELYVLVQRFSDESQEIPRPANWGGYLIRPKAIEFWHGRPSRLHDRISFRKEGEKWKMERLAP